MLQQAAMPWSPETHTLFPASSRSLAVSLLFIGLQLRNRLVAAGAPVGSAFAPDIWVSFVIPLAVSRAQCGQKGCIVRIHGLTGSPELNGMMGVLSDEGSNASHRSDSIPTRRCGVQVASRPKAISVRWQNLGCRCARCLTSIENELGFRPEELQTQRSTTGFGPSHYMHMRADDLMLHVHNLMLQSRARPQGDQSHRALLKAPVLLSQLMSKSRA
eukprot:2551169-Prymnesium_polylepis.1